MAQTDKMASIGQLSAGIAHGINNPLGIILGYTQLLIRDENVESERYADLKIIEKHAKNCRSVVEDLLNFARSSQTEKEAVKIHKVMDEVLNFIQHHSEIYNIEIEKNYDVSIPPLLLDEKKIKHALMNLIMNAKHAVGESGTIRLSTEYNRSTNQVTIKIADTGYGIEKKNISRIFDPFFTTKPTGEGTGLGLSVSYGIIKNHGGNIFVESVPGKGATFTVVLTAVSRDP
jgi:signal transduction histidine kinase